MSDEDYARGWQDGKADRDPDPHYVAYGADRCNDYEIGYIDSGRRDAVSPFSPSVGGADVSGGKG